MAQEGASGGACGLPERREGAKGASRRPEPATLAAQPDLHERIPALRQPPPIRSRRSHHRADPAPPRQLARAAPLYSAAPGRDPSAAQGPSRCRAVRRAHAALPVRQHLRQEGAVHAAALRPRRARALEGADEGRLHLRRRRREHRRLFSVRRGSRRAGCAHPGDRAAARRVRSADLQHPPESVRHDQGDRLRRGRQARRADDVRPREEPRRVRA